MTWFLIALLVALGGILAAYRRGKRQPVVVPAPAAPEGERINMEDPAEVARHAKALGVDAYDLKGAVQEVGPGIDAVRKALRDK